MILASNNHSLGVLPKAWGLASVPLQILQEYKKEQKQKSIPVGPPKLFDPLSPLILHLFLFAFFMKWGRLS